MRVFLSLILLVCGGAAQAAGLQNTLHDRCVAAIAASGQPADVKALKEEVMFSDANHFMFQYKDASGGTFMCDACDDDNPANAQVCTIGLRLLFAAKEGADNHDLPAEMDRKCGALLQRELNPPKGNTYTVDYAMLKRMQITPEHTDKRWVYQIAVDGNAYRCVIRKSDGDFSVDKKKGDDWKPLAGGKMF